MYFQFRIALLGLLLVAPPDFDAQAAEPKAPIPILIDTDFGSDIDDAFAVGLALASPELEIIGITTVGGGNEYDPYVSQRKDRDDHRAWLVTRFLTQARFTPPPPTDAAAERAPSAFQKAILKDAKEIPVAAGADPQPKMPIGGMIQYRRHPAAIYNRTLKPIKESAVELMTKLLSERDGVTIIAIGPLTNVARVITEQPAAAQKIKRIVLMGGSVAFGYDGKKKADKEWNILCDIKAAQTVFNSKIPLLVVPLDATAMVALDEKLRSDLFAAHTPLTWQLQNLYELWALPQHPVLFDSVAIAAAFNPQHLTIQELPLQVTDDGFTVVKEGSRKIPVATKIEAPAFLQWNNGRLKSIGQESLPQPPKNVAKLIDPGKFPARVHAFEDYETDIEKRWIMSGKLAPDHEGAASHRVCLSVLTQDFDDRQGDTKTMYSAVVFNPVPGPPMGPNTRLKFQYKLTGTDTLRIQLYSLSNGYHRYLSVTGLEQNKWLEGCVDMTQMRRPDGTGGPLAENERIDDIQFYVDPRATVMIDNIVLYDAAPEKETRSFPQRIVFTAWFDSGKQGKEWPGTFDIVEHAKPRAGKFAQSVKGTDELSRLDVSLRGERSLDAKVELALLLRSSSEKPVAVQLLNQGKETAPAQSVAIKQPGEWQAVTLRFDLPKGSKADELRLRSVAGSVFGIDDLLLYTPSN